MQIEQAANEFSLRDVLQTLRRRKWYVLAPALTLLIAAAVIAFSLPNRYRARVLIAAEPAVARSHVRTEQAEELTYITEQLRAVRETLLSRPVLEKVITELNLYPRKGEAVPDAEIEAVKSRVNVQVQGDYTFYLGFDGDSKEQATAVANRLGQLFIDRASAFRERRAREESLFLEDELGRVREQLLAQDRAIRDYKSGKGGLFPEGAESGLHMVETLQKQQQEVSGRIAEEEARQASTQAEMKALEDQGVQQLSEPKELRDRRAELRALSSRYKKGHPEMQRLQKEIAALEARDRSSGQASDELSPLYNRFTQLSAEQRGSELRLASFRAELAGVGSKLAEYQRQLEAAPEHERALAKMTHDYELLQTQYQTLLDRQQDAKLSTRLEELYKGLVFTVIEPARPPANPHSPKRARMILLGLVAGIGLGALLAFGREHMDTSFFEQEEVRSATGLPVFAGIPFLVNGNGHKPGRPNGKLSAPPGPSSLAAEQYRLLGVRLREQLGSGPWALGVTSAVGGEGKTTTAINLAIELASVVEGNVLLVDGDLRRPRVQRALGLSPQPGLSELLSRRDGNVIKCISRLEVSGLVSGNGLVAGNGGRGAAKGVLHDSKALYVLPGGAPRTDSLRLLESQWGHAIFDRLKREFEIVILDLPPMLPIADSRVLARLTTGVLLVVRSRRTRRELLPRALDGFDSSKILGVVLNDVDFRLSPCEYAYRYYNKNYVAAS
jgi:polysaccharide chain length determinant protein (PEP-CTERM system associated)